VRKRAPPRARRGAEFVIIPDVRLLFLAIASLLVIFSNPPGLDATQPSFDLLVRNARVIDGTGAPARTADIGVAGGRITAVGSLAGASAREVVDAGGRVVAPGFIDVHTHADEIAEHPLAEHFVQMGVTTVIAGNCGASADNIADSFRAIEAARVAVNYATLFGHNTVRRAVMGTERRAPTAAELTKMQQLVEQAMRDGAVGFSTGLQYVPGTYADQAEVIALAKAAARVGGVYASHMRNEGTELESAVRETIEIGEASGLAVEISHLKVDAPSRWGASAKALAMMDSARARGMRVAADVYLYDAASSNLGIRFPSWVLEGGQPKINERLDDDVAWARIRDEMKKLIRERGLESYDFARIASYRTDPSLNGLSIPEAARKVLGKADIDTQLEMMRRMLRAGGASMVYQFMAEDDIGQILRHPHVAIASDSGLNVMGEGVPHPRGYGNAARALGRYVRERKVIGLEEAVRKMTSLPADHFGFSDRGRIAVGQAADLVIFDPARVADRATYEQPHQYPDGITAVYVNGVAVVREGTHTKARPGQVVRAQ
jgi:N-acyl-D-amino-acid deacylase